MMSNKKNKISSQAGFSLIEIALGLGILSIVLLGSMTAFVQANEMMNRVEAKQAFISLQTAVRSLTSMQPTCKAAIGGDVAATMQNYSAEAEAPLLADGTLNNAGGLNVRFNLPNDTLQQDAKLTNYPLRVDSLKIYEARQVAVDGAGDRIFFGTLIGNFSPTKKGPMPMTGQNLGSLFFKVTAGNKINDCFDALANDQANMDAYDALQCQNAGGIYQNGNCDLVPTICNRLNGTMVNNYCRLTASAPAAPAPTPRPSTPFIPLPGPCVGAGGSCGGSTY